MQDYDCLIPLPMLPHALSLLLHSSSPPFSLCRTAMDAHNFARAALATVAAAVVFVAIAGYAAL